MRTLLICSIIWNVSGLITTSLRMTTSRDSPAVPVLQSVDFKKSLSKVASLIPLAMVVTNPRISDADPRDVLKKPLSTELRTVNLPLGKDGYTDLGGLPMCRLLNGMWQVSGAHGYSPQKDKAVSEMSHCAGVKWWI
jgi:hypothetical protein